MYKVPGITILPDHCLCQQYQRLQGEIILSAQSSYGALILYSDKRILLLQFVQNARIIGF